MPSKSWVFKSIKVGLSRAEYRSVLSLANLYAMTETAMARRLVRDGAMKWMEKIEITEGEKRVETNPASLAKFGFGSSDFGGQARVKKAARPRNAQRPQFGRVGGCHEAQKKRPRKTSQGRHRTTKKTY